MRENRRLLVPEVVQTSAMDCGPAALHAALKGYDLPSSYGRLREACQTEIDGTSINTLEDTANALGLEAQQVLMPHDHVLASGSEALPAIAVTRLPNGLTHFVLLWRRLGQWVQVMDPEAGRRWRRWRELEAELYRHAMTVPATQWLTWVTSEEGFAGLYHRADRLDLGAKQLRALSRARDTPEVSAMACWDATLRMTQAIVEDGAVRKGGEARELHASLLDQARQADDPMTIVPDEFWSFRPMGMSREEGEPIGEVRGAILLRFHGRSSTTPKEISLPPELEAARTEPPERPLREAVEIATDGRRWRLLPLLAPAFVAGSAVVIEATILRGTMEISTRLANIEQQLGAATVLLAFLGALLLLEGGVAGWAVRLGRHLDIKIRGQFARKLERLENQYLQSRPSSDMAKRCHDLHETRTLPLFGSRTVFLGSQIVATTAGLMWLWPPAAPLSLLAGATTLACPWIFKGSLEERDHRVRTHSGALSRFYLDSLLGLETIRAHRAESSVENEHESLLAEWAEAMRRRYRGTVALATILSASGFAFAVTILSWYARSGEETASVLLLAFWALSLPLLGEMLAREVAAYPGRRNALARALEPLKAPERHGPGKSPRSNTGPSPFRIHIHQATIRAAGHDILPDLSLELESGEHVAIVGPSGAGKSTLLSALLGWHRPTSGEISVGGRSMREEGAVTEIRNRTAWIDPAVHIWNRTLRDNLIYGHFVRSDDEIGEATEDAGLTNVIRHLENGTATRLGENGRRLSGGEGQRVRVARGLLTPDPGMILLDEPFRGLPAAERETLLDEMRSRFPKVTLLCVTHDVRLSLRFPRVLVMDRGRIVQDGHPRELLAHDESTYLELYHQQAPHAQASSTWRTADLRRGRIADGS